MDSLTHLVLCLQEAIDREATLHKYDTPQARASSIMTIYKIHA